MGVIYDKFYNVLYYRQKQKGGDRMDYDAFETFLGSLADWAKNTADDQAAAVADQDKVGKIFKGRLFNKFDAAHQGSISLQVHF